MFFPFLSSFSSNYVIMLWNGSLEKMKKVWTLIHYYACEKMLSLLLAVWLLCSLLCWSPSNALFPWRIRYAPVDILKSPSNITSTLQYLWHWLLNIKFLRQKSSNNMYLFFLINCTTSCYYKNITLNLTL